MSQDANKKPIVVKRIKKVAGMAHGGAWKIAYADFVTAMMAFFLLMWLLGSTAQGDLKGISEFFKTPLKVALLGGSGSGESTSIIKGGGGDITRKTGEKQSENLKDKEKIPDVESIQKAVERMERIKEVEKLKELKSKIEKAIENSPTLKKFKNQILLDMTTEGLRIQIVDEKNRPMFSLGSAELEPYTREIMHEIGRMLNEVPNKVSLSGHTDAALYYGGNRGYSNWELSSDRANASRRELIYGGMAAEKIIRVVGLSSAVLFNKDDPLNPMNRRISLIVMNKKAEEAARHDGGIVDEAGGVPAEMELEATSAVSAAPILH